jgi:methionyl aminopeptidase
MITIKDKRARQKMATAGMLLAQVFSELEPYITAGATTLELDKIIAQLLHYKKLISQSKGYKGYQHVSCISVNDEVVHGIPSASKRLNPGDLVKVDVCAAWEGYCADMARCFFVEKALAEAQRLVDVAYRALDRGIEQAQPGKRLGDISAAIQTEVERAGFGVVRDFAGHGIGKRMHEDPEVLNYGKSGQGPLLRAGMSLALEPMITAGDYAVYVMPDGWTAKTRDGSLAAHVEDTVIITEEGPHIITRVA